MTEADAGPLRRLLMGGLLGAVSGALAVGEMRAFQPVGAGAFRAGFYCLLAVLLVVDPWILGSRHSRARGQLALAAALVGVWCATSLAGSLWSPESRGPQTWLASLGAAAVGWAAAELALLFDALRRGRSHRLLAVGPALLLALLLPMAASPGGDHFWMGPLPLVLGLALGGACAFGAVLLAPGAVFRER